ncbi:MAG: CBS domain-containing protein [Gemmatimonadota bacterium]|jgi:CBS domain-containing protein
MSVPVAQVHVKDVMNSPAVTVGEKTSLKETARLMLDKGIGCVLVVNAKGRLTGIIAARDFCARTVRVPFSTQELPQVFGHWLGTEGAERAYAEAGSLLARDIMRSPVHSVDEDDSIDRVLELMLRHDIGHVPVLRGSRPVGLVSGRDLLKLMLDHMHD